MQNRIKEVRKYFGLNQTEFGARLGVATSTVGGWEGGARAVSDAVVLSICREFGVNDTWLRTGYGEMFRPRSPEEELGDLIRTRLLDVPDSFQAALVKMLLRLEPNGPELRRLRQFCEDLMAETKKEDPEA